MAFAYTWNSAFEAVPADNDNISEGAEKLRDHKKAVSERLEIDHSWAGDAEDGKHKQLTLIEQTDPGTPDAAQAYLWPAAIDATTGLFVSDDAGLISQPDCGYEALSDAAKTLVAGDASYLDITPTADRIIDLPTTNVRGGRRFTIYNKATEYNTIVKASGGAHVATWTNGHITFMATENSPTDASGWRLIDGSGGGKPSFSVLKDTNEHIQTDQFTTIVWEDTRIDFDTANALDTDVTNAWTPLVPGKYQVNLQVRGTNLNVSSGYLIFIYQGDPTTSSWLSPFAAEESTPVFHNGALHLVINMDGTTGSALTAAVYSSSDDDWHLTQLYTKFSGALISY